MSKTVKKQSPWNNRNPHAEGARLRKAGAMQDRRLRRSGDAGRNWLAEWETEEADEQAYWDNFDRQMMLDMGEGE